MMLFVLPREIRETIYNFVFEDVHYWKGKRDLDYYYPELDYQVAWVTTGSSSSSIVDEVGDEDPTSGFCFPFPPDTHNTSILRVNRQMRREALPLAYRRTQLSLANMDHLINLLVAVGRIGRENIQRLQFDWKSYTETDNIEQQLFSYLPPLLHAKTCVRLLKQCKRLRHLRIDFDGDAIFHHGHPDVFKTNPGILELCSLRGIFETVEIWAVSDHFECLEVFEDSPLTNWLRDEMKRSN